MLGAIAGDIIGSIHEHAGTKTRAFTLFAPGVTFTDDTVCTVAVAACLLDGGDFAASLRSWGRTRYRFDITCKGTVPPALVCAFEAAGYEDAVRTAISLGGDADTLACITGGLAEVLFGLPEAVAVEARSRLDPPLGEVVERFYAKVGAG